MSTNNSREAGSKTVPNPQPYAARCPHCGSTIGTGTGTHHEGVWTVNAETGECGCECSRCYVDDECVCTDCTYDHDHSRRGIREAGFDA